MTVSELIQRLQDVPDPASQVYLSTDEEGNNFHKFSGDISELYTQDGELVWPDEDDEGNETPYQVTEDMRPAIVLWP